MLISIFYLINCQIPGHMHNLYYLDLAYEALPEEVYEQRPFDDIRIMYKKEIKLGEIVICKYTKLEDKNIVVIESQDGKVLHAMIALADKKWKKSWILSIVCAIM